MPEPLKILFIAAEVAPLMKTGGLADVANALPKKLREMGHDVRVFMPCYGGIPDDAKGAYRGGCEAQLGGETITGGYRESRLPESDVPLFLIEHNGYFGRERPYDEDGKEYEDNLARFSFFSMASLNAARSMNWRPDVVHCNDWHTAPIPAYLKTTLAYDSFWQGVASLYTIHNLAYQGRYPAWMLPESGLGWELFSPDCLEFFGDINLMKAAIRFASKINTVSRRYAKEIQSPEYGHGLDGFLRTRSADISGILNGVDYSEWNPTRNDRIPANYSAEDLTGRRKCKAALQEHCGFPQRDVPIFGMVSRFTWQKGLDLIAESMDEMLEHDVQLVFLGTGERHFEDIFADRAQRFPDKVWVSLKYDAVLPHLIKAGSDFFFMPSHFEPSGLSQLYCLAYGCVPIVRKTGGLADSIRDCTRANLDNGRATGIVFAPKTPAAFTEAFKRAFRLYQDRETLDRVRVTGMRQDFSWNRAAEEYVKLYGRAIENP